MDKINNNINFTARMDLKGIKKNMQRWESISEKFSSKTQDIDDTFTLMEKDSGLEVEAFDEGLIHFGEKTLKKLLKLTDEEVAEKFKKLSDIFVQKRKTLNAAHKNINNFRSRTAPDEFEDIADSIMDKAISKIYSDAETAINSDKLLKKADVWL